VPISQLDTFVVGDIQEFSEPQVRMFERVVAFTRTQNARANAPNRLGNFAGGGNQGKPYVNELEQIKTNHPAENVLIEDLDNLIAKHSPQARTYSFTLQNLIDNLGNDVFLRTIQPFERTTASALESKLTSIGRSGMLDWNATNRTDYLPIDDLLVGGRLSVLDVSETDDKSRNIAIAYVLQSLFNRVIEFDVDENMSNQIPRPKIMVVLEEVHTFVSRSSVSKMRAVLDNLQLISRRGRKRWMSLAIVSQQPGHVPDELFELANTRFIHQLKSASNLAPVKQTTGGVHEALWSTMPSLGPGQCLLTGAVFKNPLFVNMRPAKTRRLLTN
jgi:DNA helicase HerA-like ATPase